MKATYWYARGIERVAETHGISIPEATIIGITPGPHNVVTPEDTADALDAHASLNPGHMYIQGLRAMSNVTEVLSDATKRAVTQAEKVSADEHIKSITAAFRYLTGKKFSRTS